MSEVVGCYAYIDEMPGWTGGRRRLAALGFARFGVTMPLRETVPPLVDELDETVRLSGW